MRSLTSYTAKRDLFCQGLDSIGLEHNVPQGAYYVMMDISEFGYDSDLEFCEDLARLKWVWAPCPARASSASPSTI